MALFNISTNKVKPYRTLSTEENHFPFKSEFELRDYFADNLDELLGVRFIDKEYQILEGRIDTIGIDENNSPVIIEYKWKENEEVLAQGLFYYNWLQKNHKHFDLLVENRFGKDVKVSWDRPRVILVAQGFSRYVLGAVQQQPNVELFSYRCYESGVLDLKAEYVPKDLKLPKKKEEKTEDSEVEFYDLQRHLDSTSAIMAEAFGTLREKILQLPDVEENDQQKTGVTYRGNKSIVRFEFKPNWIHVLLRDPKYSIDKKGLVKDIASNGWGYKGGFKFTPDTDIDYLFNLILASRESTL
jgi:predicted transport protein